MNSAIEALEKLVGEIPEDSEAETIVDYVDEQMGAASALAASAVAKVNALDFEDDVEGDYVSSVKQEDGKISLVKGTFNFDEKGAAAAVQANLETALTWGEF